MKVALRLEAVRRRLQTCRGPPSARLQSDRHRPRSGAGLLRLQRSTMPASYAESSLQKDPPVHRSRVRDRLERMVLVCPERLWACKKGWEQFHRHRPARFINLNWREDYLGKGGSPDRALAISIWESPNASRCQYEVWSKPYE